MRIWPAIENKLQSFLFKDCLINLICLLFYFFIFRILDLFGYFMRWTLNKIEMIDFLFFVLLVKLPMKVLRMSKRFKKRWYFDFKWFYWWCLECDLSIWIHSVLFMIFNMEELIQKILSEKNENHLDWIHIK